ncbi:hypothetical protein ACS0TY_005094 [Phlomoides rotata]
MRQRRWSSVHHRRLFSGQTPFTSPPPSMDSERRSNFKILMFPWLAHGHIFPFLELAKRILKIKNFHIYLCTTPINFSSIDAFIHANSLRNSIELVQP